MQGKGNRHPLVFLHPAVIMGIQISNAAVLINRILLNIQPGRINMGSQNIHAFLHRLFPNLVHNQAFVHIDGINLISWLNFASAFQ